jgi:hypothetical protein
MSFPVNTRNTISCSASVYKIRQTMYCLYETLIIQTQKSKALSLGHAGAKRERKYNSYSFSTSALDGGQWSASRPGRVLAPRKGPPVSIVQEAGWAPEPVWTQRLGEKSFASARDRTPDVVCSGTLY